MEKKSDSKEVQLRSAEAFPKEQAGLLGLLTKVNAYLENLANLGGYLLKLGTCLLVFFIAGAVVNGLAPV